MTTYDYLLAFDNKMKIHQRHLQFLAIEVTNLKINLTQVSCGKHKSRKISHIHWEGTYSRLNSKRKHSEIWKKIMKFQREFFVKQPTNKD